MLLAAGAEDQTVLPRNTRHLTEAMRRNGGRVEERIYPGVNHTRIIGAMAGVLHWLAPSMADVTGFLGRQALSSVMVGAGAPSMPRDAGVSEGKAAFGGTSL
jgi:hypothetical protein